MGELNTILPCETCARDCFRLFPTISLLAVSPEGRNRMTPQKKQPRFKISKLEERIAPKITAVQINGGGNTPNGNANGVPTTNLNPPAPRLPARTKSHVRRRCRRRECERQWSCRARGAYSLARSRYGDERGRTRQSSAGNIVPPHKEDPVQQPRRRTSRNGSTIRKLEQRIAPRRATSRRGSSRPGIRHSAGQQQQPGQQRQVESALNRHRAARAASPGVANVGRTRRRENTAR